MGFHVSPPLLVGIPAVLTFGSGDRNERDNAGEGGVKSALSCKQGDAHYIDTLSASGGWN